MAGARASAGRILTTVGILWMAWSILVGFFEPARDILDLPFLPGLLFFFVGRALNRAGKRERLPDTPTTSREERRTIEPLPEPPRARVPRREPVTSRGPEPETPYESAAAADVRSEQEMPDKPPELPDLEDVELPPPMTSKEMVAEARRRFGPHRKGSRGAL